MVAMVEWFPVFQWFWKVWPKRRLSPEPKLPVLIVEDYEPHKELLAFLVQRCGYTCDLVSNLKQAYVLFAVRKYGMAFVDIKLEGNILAGVTMMRAMRLDNPNTKVVLVTSSDEMNDVPISTYVRLIRKPICLECIENALNDL
jgi:CheY-like chemotaxis protein